MRSCSRCGNEESLPQPPERVRLVEIEGTAPIETIDFYRDDRCIATADAMAAAGLRLDRFYTAHFNCSPTRASVMTGRHPHRMGTFSPAQVRGTPVGTAVVSFNDGNAGTFSYQVNDGANVASQSKPITRQVFRPPGTVCQ
jgi:hypothetical protein